MLCLLHSFSPCISLSLRDVPEGLRENPFVRCSHYTIKQQLSLRNSRSCSCMQQRHAHPDTSKNIKNVILSSRLDKSQF
jgi:hypothetical protein